MFRGRGTATETGFCTSSIPLGPTVRTLSTEDIDLKVSYKALAHFAAHGSPRGTALLEALTAAGDVSGGRWRGSLLLVRGAPRDGFWVRALQAFSLGAWATMHGANWAVLANYSDAFWAPRLGGSLSGWEQYFVPSHSVPLSSVLDEQRAWREGRGGRGGRAPRALLEMSCDATMRLSFSTFSAPDHVYPRQAAAAARWRRLGAAAADAWLRPRSEIEAEADAQWARLIGAGPASSSEAVGAAATGAAPPVVVLGVHMRGTDKHLRPKVAPERYYRLIDAFVAHHEGRRNEARNEARNEGRNEGRGRRDQARRRDVRLFLATDDQAYAAAVVARYGSASHGGRVVQQQGIRHFAVTEQAQGGVLRGRADAPIWGAAASAEGASGASEEAPAYRRGVEVLLDTLLLSRCAYLLKSASAVSEFAIYLNPRLANASYDFNIDDQAEPSWLNSDVQYE